MKNDLPDAITNPKTPRDQDGELIADGGLYELSKRGEKPRRVTVREDEHSDLWCVPEGGESWQRVDQMDPAASWTKVES